MDLVSLVLIIIAGLLFGTEPLFASYLSKLGFSPMQMSSGRFAISAVIILVFMLFRNPKGLIHVKPVELLLYFVSGVTMYATGTLYYSAMQHISSSVAIILLYTCPIFVTISSAILFREKITVKKIISLAAIMLGCCFITGVFGGIKFSVFGIFLGFMSSFTNTIYDITTKFEMRRKCDPIIAVTYTLIFAGLMSFFFANPIDTVHTIMQNPLPGTLLMFGIAIFTGALPYTLFTLVMKKIPAGVASAMVTLEPLTATVISVTVLGEPFNAFMAIGIVLILGAVILLGFQEEN